MANEVNYKIKPRKAKTTNQKVLKAIRKIQVLYKLNLLLQFLGTCLKRNLVRKILGLTWTIHYQKHILLLISK